MTAPEALAFIEMPAESSRAAAFDRLEDFHVLYGNPITAALDELPARGADNVGHLNGWPVHLRLLCWLCRRIRSRQRVQWTRRSLQMPLRYMEINSRLFQIAVTEQHLNGAQVRSVL